MTFFFQKSLWIYWSLLSPFLQSITTWYRICKFEGEGGPGNMCRHITAQCGGKWPTRVLACCVGEDLSGQSRPAASPKQLHRSHHCDRDLDPQELEYHRSLLSRPSAPEAASWISVAVTYSLLTPTIVFVRYQQK